MTSESLPFADVFDVSHVTSAQLAEEGGFSERFRNKRPVCITDVVSKWPATASFQDAAHVADGFAASRSADDGRGMEEVEVFVAHDDRTFVKSEAFTTVQRMPIEALLAHVFPEDAHALRAWRAGRPPPPPPPLSATVPPALGDKQRLYLRSEIPGAFYERDVLSPAEVLFGDASASGRFKARNNLMWISTAGNVTPLHYDRCHGLLCQLRGEKRVYFVSPEQSTAVYQQPPHSPLSHTSRVDFQAVLDGADLLARYPKLASLDVACLHLKPGMCCYIPPGHWHHVVTLTASISVTWAWDPTVDEQLPPNMFR